MLHKSFYLHLTFSGKLWELPNRHLYHCSGYIVDSLHECAVWEALLHLREGLKELLTFTVLTWILGNAMSMQSLEIFFLTLYLGILSDNRFSSIKPQNLENRVLVKANKFIWMSIVNCWWISKNKRISYNIYSKVELINKWTRIVTS